MPKKVSGLYTRHQSGKFALRSHGTRQGDRKPALHETREPDFCRLLAPRAVDAAAQSRS
jgi:hypothetical protein